MNVTIPIYVEASRRGGASVPRFSCRPLFFPGISGSDEQLKRAMNKLVKELQRKLDGLGRSWRHDELAAYTFCPDVETHRHDFKFELRSGRFDCRLLLVMFRSLERRVAFAPNVPDVWFEVGRGERLRIRACEVLSQHFRDLERRDREADRLIQEASLQGDAWVTTLELAVRTRPADPRKLEQNLASLWGGGVADGATELENVGRCLDWLYPDDLHRAMYRHAEVAELDRLLHSGDRRPVVLLGRRQVGKTTVLHEFLHRTVAQRKSPYAARHNVWLISPQRLIAGMSFLGQWESRLLAILKVAGRRDHVLYFDDILGLYQAGVTRDSRLCAADVLKPFVERRNVRVLAEMTPESFRVLQERDRGLADEFHVIPIEEPDGPTSLRMLIAVQRELEKRYRAKFDLEVLPTVNELVRRYVRDAALPGKAAALLRQLAAKHPAEDVGRAEVFREFHARSGLSLAFADRRSRLQRDEILSALGRQVIGQRAALEAVADIVSVAKAQLNDPRRPLGSLLFLGPTGVGKTQCAKALAAYLFGDAERLVRFDMNEFVSPHAATRLIGTFAQPDGLLTSAIRRQPFSVVLLDEIEKAHPDVFDLLLQLLGEGRLSDARGRTADFSNAIVVLTSNLGTREAGASVGFRADQASDAPRYVQAAERFFRPEFFNRLDRVVPFDRLSRGEVRRIAESLMAGVLNREGLVRRKCMLQVDPRALDQVVDHGYHPLLGARALKREIERQLAQPVAARLAAARPDCPTVIGLYPRRQGIAVEVQGLVEISAAASSAAVAPPAEPADDVSRSRRQLAAVAAVVDRVEDAIAPWRPTGSIVPGEIAPEQYRYFLVKEHVRRVRETAQRLADQIASQSRGGQPPRFAPTVRRGRLRNWKFVASQRRVLLELASAEDIHAYLRELTSAAPLLGERPADRMLELFREVALLTAMAAAREAQEGDEVVLLVRDTSRSGASYVGSLMERYVQLFSDRLGVENRPLPSFQDAEGQCQRALLLSGPHARRLADLEAGTHLICPADGNLVPLAVRALAFPRGGDARQVAAEFVAACERWRRNLFDGTAVIDDNPARLVPVVRVYDERGATVDLRSGLSVPAFPTAEELCWFLLASLPLPPELYA